MREILLGEHGLTLKDVAAIARDGAVVRLSEAAKGRICSARELVEQWVREGRIIYGITTGFGALSDVTISAKDARLLQNNIIMSHAAGVGSSLDREVVRAAMALRVQDFARGHAGVRYETAARLVELLNRDICPVVPEKGSVGASGDLAPLAHLALVLLGQGQAWHGVELVSGGEALRRCGLDPLRLEAAEGLALLNGTQITSALGSLAVQDALGVSRHADVAASMSLEVLMGSRTEFDPRIHAVRPHPGQAYAADNMRRITQNSEIISSHKDCFRIQDAYTLRCSPQVHGASKDAINYVKKVMETEINSATNNPLIFPECREFLLGGNFHGQPLGLALDFMAMAAAELASISERRIERLVNPQLSGLPAFLVENGGLNSGFMIVQYTAAALVSENKVLCHPACVDSIPTSANKEDHVPMSTISARKCREIVKNSQYVLAIELLCGAQALDLFTNLKPGEGTMAAYRTIRNNVTHLESDRILSKDVETVVGLLRSGEIVNAVEKAVGVLH